MFVYWCLGSELWIFCFCRKVISTQVLFYFILEDFVFYWGHRILHTKWLYKHVHSVHHESVKSILFSNQYFISVFWAHSFTSDVCFIHRYATPFGLTSEYAHPAEILFLGFATIVGPIITGPHLITLWLWMIVRVLETVEAHCGYHFPWSLSNFLPLYGGSVHKFTLRELLVHLSTSTICLKLLLLFPRADFHDYHHRLLYTKSGNYSSTFVYMDW